MKKVPASDLFEADDKFVDQVVAKLEERNSGQSQTEDLDEKIYTIEEIAEMSNVKVNAATLRRYANNYKNGHTNKMRLKATKKGRSWMVKESDLRKFLK